MTTFFHASRFPVSWSIPVAKYIQEKTFFLNFILTANHFFLLGNN